MNLCRLDPDYKRAKREGNESVFIGFRAKIIINRHGVRDEFPEWNNIIKMSRITNLSNEIQVDVNNMQPIQQATSTIYSESEGSECELTDTPPDENSQPMAQLDSQIRNRNKKKPRPVRPRYNKHLQPQIYPPPPPTHTHS